MRYRQQLKTQEWYKKSGLVKLRDGNKCTQCDSYGPLHVHHTFYEAGRMAWDYPDESLVTLCLTCHKNIHKITKVPRKQNPNKVRKPTITKEEKRCTFIKAQIETHNHLKKYCEDNKLPFLTDTNAIIRRVYPDFEGIEV
jgi:5-methylcytosine-specific restriction endonuclease McrA